MIVHGITNNNYLANHNFKPIQQRFIDLMKSDSAMFKSWQSLHTSIDVHAKI